MKKNEENKQCTVNSLQLKDINQLKSITIYINVNNNYMCFAVLFEITTNHWKLALKPINKKMELN